MEQTQAFVTMNNYVMARYVAAYSHAKDIDIVVREQYSAYGAFQMFRMFYTNAFSDEQFDNFWNFYKEAFEALYNTALLRG